MTDTTDLRRRVYDAARAPAIRLTESTLKLARVGGVFHLNSTEADEIAQAVMDLIEPVLAETARLRELLARGVDDDPCDIDHNGLCQTHWLSPAPCRNAEARLLLGMDGQR